MVSQAHLLNRRSVGRKRLGESLVDQGYITEAEIQKALAPKALPAIDRRRCAQGRRTLNPGASPTGLRGLSS